MDGVVVSRESVPHPTLPDIYTMGHCDTESYASDYAGPDTTRSVVVLFWGSFRSLAHLDPDFDWDGELWETLTHELRHHLESLAGEDALEGVDYALDETFKRDEGQAFDPWYWQRGEELGDGVYRVEGSYYVERELSAEDFAATEAVELTWYGVRYLIPRPEEQGDVHFVWLEGVEGGDQESVELVLVRKRSWWGDARRLFGTHRPVVMESHVTAQRVDG